MKKRAKLQAQENGQSCESRENGDGDSDNEPEEVGTLFLRFVGVVISKKQYVASFCVSIQEGMYPLPEEESGCDEDEEDEEEEIREEEEFDSDESLVDSDSDSDEKGLQDYFVDRSDVYFCKCKQIWSYLSALFRFSQLPSRPGRPDVRDRDQAEANR